MPLRIFLLFFSLVAASAFAGRLLPQDAQRGVVQGHNYPAVQIGGQIYRLAPGARIYDTANRMILPAQLPQQANVFFRLDGNGDLTQLWLSTPEEEAAAGQGQ
jgi:hypothetical protein